MKRIIIAIVSVIALAACATGTLTAQHPKKFGDAFGPPGGGFTPPTRLAGVISALTITDTGALTVNGLVTTTGHESTGAGAAPSLSSCGTSPAVTGSDLAAKVTTGSAATTCTITFASTYTQVPACVLFTEGSATAPTCTVSATAITCTVVAASTKYNYICVGPSGST